jgi:hypothetical protein
MELLIVGIVLAAAVALYIMERWSKGEEIVVADAGKIGIAASALTGGILFAVGGSEEAITLASDTATTVVDVAQDMFVGKPAF